MNDLLHGIVHQSPNYLAYATSFITIGGIWLAHHAGWPTPSSAT